MSKTNKVGAVARDANKLVPVCIDAVNPPLGFRQVHAIKAPKGPDQPDALAAIEAALARLAEGNAPGAAPSSGSTGWRGIAVLPFEDLKSRTARQIYVHAYHRQAGWARQLLGWTLRRMVQDPARAVDLNTKVLLASINRPRL